MPERESDQFLLHRYVAERCESAFAELVRRHAGMVYATALRQLRDTHQAEDATQAVFLLLAQRAHTIGPGVVVAGWLYRSAQFTAAAARRSAQRRRIHEQQAAERMKIASQQPAMATEFESALDGAILRLRQGERDALILRYLEDMPLAEVGRAMRISEDAARVRVGRALVKLRRMMAKGLEPAALPTWLARHAIVAAPQHVVDASCLLGGSAPSNAVTTIAKGALTMIMQNKLRIAAAYALGTLVVLGGVAAIVTAAQNAGPPASTQPADTAQTPQGALHAMMLALLTGDAAGARSLIYVDGAPDADAADTGAFDRAAKVQQTFLAALRKAFGDAAAADAFSNPPDRKQPAATKEEINGDVSVIHYNTGPYAYALPMIRIGGQWKLDLSRRPGEERSQEIIQGTRRIRPQLIEQARKIAQAYDLVTRKINGGEYSTASAAMKELRTRIAPPAEPRGK